MSDNKQSSLLKKIQQYNFAAYDMLLYLDTHPDDKEAFEMYQELMATYLKSLNDYQKNYAPLTIEGAAQTSEFTWLNSPWPWENKSQTACAIRRED